MGAICNCSEKSQGTMSLLSQNLQIKDPRLVELHTLIKILDSKLNSNLASIDDFKQLLVETRKEPVPHTDIAAMIK